MVGAAPEFKTQHVFKELIKSDNQVHNESTIVDSELL